MKHVKKFNEDFEFSEDERKALEGQVSPEQLKMLREKARKYDEISNAISKFYDEDPDMDLYDIGEYISTYFGHE